MTLYMNGKPIWGCLDVSISENIEPINDGGIAFRTVQDEELTVKVNISKEAKEKIEKLIKDMMLPNCVVTSTFKEAFELLKHYCKDEDVKSTQKYPYPTIKYKNGCSTIFVPEQAYPGWCKGRVYMKNGIKMRSGYPVKESDNK